VGVALDRAAGAARPLLCALHIDFRRPGFSLNQQAGVAGDTVVGQHQVELDLVPIVLNLDGDLVALDLAFTMGNCWFSLGPTVPVISPPLCFRTRYPVVSRRFPLLVEVRKLPDHAPVTFVSATAVSAPTASNTAPGRIPHSPILNPDGAEMPVPL
jgi:hypothetical protein